MTPRVTLICGCLVLIGAPGPAHAIDKAEYQAAFGQALALERSGKLKQAAAMYETTLKLSLEVFGEQSANTAVVLNNLGNVYKSMGKLAQAEPPYRRSLKIKEKLFGPESAEYLRTLNNLAHLLKADAKYADAEALYRRILEVKEKLHGRQHAEFVKALGDLIDLHLAQATFPEAEALCRRALEIQEKLSGKDDVAVADCLHKLALVYAEEGKFSLAEPAYQRCLSIKEKSLGRDDPSVGSTLNNIGIMQMWQGNYAAAEPIFQRCLAIREKALGNGHPEVARVLINLAGVELNQRKHTAAEEHYQRCLAILESSQIGDRDVLIGDVLNNLAIVYHCQEKYSDAEPRYLQSLDIAEKHLGKEHRQTARRLTTLAMFYQDQKKYAEAQPLHERALAIQEKLYAKEPHPDMAVTLSNLGNSYLQQGKFAQAESAFRRSLTIYERFFGKDHPQVVNVLGSLVLALAAQGRYDDATAREMQLRQGTRQFFLRELPGLSPKEQRAWLLAGKEELRFATALSLGLRDPANPALAEASAVWLLNGKGIGLEAQSIRTRLDREITDVASREVVHQIQSLRSQESALALKLDRPEADAKQREQLERSRRELEKKLVQESGTAAKVANPWVELASVRDKIPADSVLIDMARFGAVRFDARPGEQQWLPAHYVAWVIPRTGPIQIVDLGAAAEIDAMVQAARKTLEGTVDGLEKLETEKKLESDAAAKLAAVAKLVFESLRPHLGKATKLILSPDGELWLVPWAALPAGKDRYLVEDYSLRYVVTGRDLVEFSAGKKPKTTAALILADPDYNMTPTEVAAAMHRSAPPQGTIDPTAPRVSTFLDPTMPGSYRIQSEETRGLGRVVRLPGTVVEARQAFDKLKALTGTEPRLFTEAQASETIVKEARSPQVLVLATHGFFLKKQQVETKSEASPELGGEKIVLFLKDKEGRDVENPLLRCGLLLAGANKRAEAKGDEDDGILTGLEIVGLDLRGTQLVVLSACDSGVGDVQTGEGVAGLRQAFQLAGAETVLATLWQIGDKATGQLMNGFYDELSKGIERSEALTRAQRQFIKERRARLGAAHPYFWASFTLTGK